MTLAMGKRVVVRGVTLWESLSINDMSESFNCEQS